MKTYQQIIIAIIMIALCILAFVTRKEETKEVMVPPVQTTITDSTDFYVIEAHIPIEPKDTSHVMEKMVMDVVNAKKEEWKTGGPLYNEEKDAMVQYPDRPDMKYELSIQYDKYVSQEKGMVTYVFKNYEYTGGAHGGTGLSTYTFDANGRVDIGKILDLKRENSVALTKLIAAKLKSQLGEMYNEDMLTEGLGIAYLKADGSFDKAKSDGFDFVTNFDHFIIQDEGIRFIFSQYQVAPYAAGMPEVMMSWEELKAYMR